MLSTLMQIPADVDLDVQAPGPSTPLSEARPCSVLLARITVHPTGVRVAPHPHARSWLTRAAEVALGWAAPPAIPAPAAIPIDITFERLYLGLVPSTALRMASTMLGVLTVLAIVLVPLRRPRQA